MILQALKEYYDRKPDLPRQGWEMKPFTYLVRITNQGKFFDFCDTREGEGKAKRAKEFLVPALGEKKGNGIKANLFWENIEYLFGIPVPTKGKPTPNPERIRLQHIAFVEKVISISGESNVLRAVRLFLNQLDHARIQEDPLWDEVFRLNQPILIEIIDQGPVTDDKGMRQLIDDNRDASNERGICLITGEPDEIAALEPPIRGVRGANSTGASLVSVNNKVTKGGNAGAVPAFASFMKEQGHNSPIGKTASFAYTTALNYLMRRDSSQKLSVGDATTIFWSSSETRLESEIADFFNEPPKDDPDRGTRAVADLLQSVTTGAYVQSDKETRFYVLGLTPNSARIAVRFWKVGTVPEMAEHFAQHFKDLRICHGERDREHLSLYRLLISTAALVKPENIPPNLAGETMRAVLGKPENIPPNLAGETMRAVLESLPYPQTLLHAVVRRIRAEQSKKDRKTGRQLPNVTYERAALIKACINRSMRFKNCNEKEELKVSLDENNTNIGYRLGRLFAELEKLQIRVFTQGGGKPPNSTIRDKYYGSASGTPVTVFGTLVRLSKHHLAKLENVGERVNYEKRIGLIMEAIDDFPHHLPLPDQGRFAIGYYHQINAAKKQNTVKDNS